MFEDDTDQVYLVVRNGEEQYSIWPPELTVPDGWEAQTFSGTKSECLAHINEVWTDMTPKSVRERTAAPATDGVCQDADQVVAASGHASREARTHR